MRGLTYGIGGTLTVLGVVGYIMSGAASLTALIPAIFGVLFITLGAAARSERSRKHAMHAAAVLALLGAVFTAGGLVQALRMLGGSAVERPQAVIAQAVMALLCLVFLGFAVRSFIHARRASRGT